MRMLFGCVAMHLVLAMAIPSPWWVPDLTLVGLVLAIARAPHRWLPASSVAGVAALLWAVRFPQPILAGYLLMGWLIHAAATPWDLDDLRVQSLLVGLASLLMTAGGLWLEETASLPLVGWASVRVALTLLSLPVVRSLGVLPRRRGTALPVRRLPSSEP